MIDEGFILTRENYFSPSAQTHFMGASQFKAFSRCEAAALAEIRGEYTPEVTTALLVGQYVDAHFDSTLDLFRAQHPDIFTRAGDLKADYRRAEEIIARIERDPMMVKYLSGEQQRIMTGEIESIPYKVMIDSYHVGRAIVDRKVMRDFEPVWVPGQGRVSFAEAWGYDIQGAIYQAIVRQNTDLHDGGRRLLPFILAAATKETVTDIALIEIPQHRLDSSLEIVKALAPRYDDIKHGRVPPTRCEKCDYCKQTKVLTRVVSLDEMIGEEAI